MGLGLSLGEHHGFSTVFCFFLFYCANSTLQHVMVICWKSIMKYLSLDSIDRWSLFCQGALPLCCWSKKNLYDGWNRYSKLTQLGSQKRYSESHEKRLSTAVTECAFLVMCDHVFLRLCIAPQNLVTWSSADLLVFLKTDFFSLLYKQKSHFASCEYA